MINRHCCPAIPSFCLPKESGLKLQAPSLPPLALIYHFIKSSRPMSGLSFLFFHESSDPKIFKKRPERHSLENKRLVHARHVPSLCCSAHIHKGRIFCCHTSSSPHLVIILFLVIFQISSSWMLTQYVSRWCAVAMSQINSIE